jgi:hypothetical protein
MISIRKFVGYLGAAGGIGAALALAMSSQTGLAASPADRVSDQPAVAQFTPSAACSAAIAAIKSAVIADASEDGSERAVAKTNPDAASDQTEDAAEVANFRSLFSAARTACAPAVTSIPSEPAHTFTPSAACMAAIQALKAAWAQGRAATAAQWQQLQSLAQAVRTACGWTWSGQRS